MPQTIRASAATSGSGVREPDGYRSACGRPVRVPSAFARHQHAHPVEPGHLAEAVGKLRIPSKGTVVADVDLGRPVGLSHRVATVPVGTSDEILVARRVSRVAPTRVVTGVDPEPTSLVTLVLGRDHLREPVLVTAYYGPKGLPEPLGGLAASRPGGLGESLAFWSRNALVWSPELYAEEPFATTWERMLDGRWEDDVPEAAAPGP